MTCSTLLVIFSKSTVSILFRGMELLFSHMDPQILEQLVRVRMPFGKYAGRVLCDLPVAYLEWFERKGFPKGALGMQLQTLLVIKMNGLEHLLAPLR